MSKGGGETPSSTTSTQKSEPWSELIPYLLGKPAVAASAGTTGTTAPRRLTASDPYAPLPAGSPFTQEQWNAMQMQERRRGVPYNAQTGLGDESSTALNQGDQRFWTAQDTPATPAQSGIQGLLPSIAEWYSSANQSYYPGQTLADQSPETLAAQQAIMQRARTGSPEITNAKQAVNATNLGQYLRSNPVFDLLGGTARGDMLNANPYIDKMFGQASSNVGREFTDKVMPGLASMYSQAGRYGSGAMTNATGEANRNFGDTLNNLATNIYGQNYANERQLQQQAAGVLGQTYAGERDNMMRASALAPMLAQGDYADLQAMQGVGAARDARSQQTIDDAMARFQYGQTQPLQKLQNYASLLGSVAGGGTTTANSTGTSEKAGSNPLAGALGGASMAASLGGMGGAMGALGGPFGLAGGAILGALFS